MTTPWFHHRGARVQARAARCGARAWAAPPERRQRGSGRLDPEL